MGKDCCYLSVPELISFVSTFSGFLSLSSRFRAQLRVHLEEAIVSCCILSWISLCDHEIICFSYASNSDVITSLWTTFFQGTGHGYNTGFGDIQSTWNHCGNAPIFSPKLHLFEIYKKIEECIMQEMYWIYSCRHSLLKTDEFIHGVIAREMRNYTWLL